MEKIQVKLRSLNSEYTAWLIVSAIVVSIVGSFPFGYGINGSNPYSPHYNRLLLNHSISCPTQDLQIRSTNGSNAAKSISDQLLEGVPQTLFVIGCFFGAYTAGFWPKINKIFDRRLCILATFPLYAASCAITVIAYYNPWVSWIIYMSRLVHGYSSGVACVFVPAYLREISTEKTSQKIGVIHQLFITIGIFTGNMFGHFGLLGTCESWLWANIMGVFPAMVAAIAIPFIPASPKELIMRYNDKDKARCALRKLRRREDVEDELEVIEREANSSESVGKVSFRSILKIKEYRWPLITTIVILTCQALSGINAVFFYSSYIIREINDNEAFVQGATLVIAGFNVFFTFLAFPIIDWLGMRKTLMSTLIAMAAAHIFEVIFVVLATGSRSAALQWSSVIFLVIFVFFFAVGIGPIAFMYPTDVFERRAVDTALSIGLSFNYIANAIVSQATIPLYSTIGGYVFLIFAVFVSLTVVLLTFKMQGPNSGSVKGDIKLDDTSE
ncbi:hypothetical protein ACOME3_001323 [Neoechinorhynchus agilis]